MSPVPPKVPVLQCGDTRTRLLQGWSPSLCQRGLQEWHRERGQSQRGTPSCARSSREGGAAPTRSPGVYGEKPHVSPRYSSFGDKGAASGPGAGDTRCSRVPRVRKTHFRVFYLLLFCSGSAGGGARGPPGSCDSPGEEQPRPPLSFSVVREAALGVTQDGLQLLLRLPHPLILLPAVTAPSVPRRGRPPALAAAPAHGDTGSQAGRGEPGVTELRFCLGAPPGSRQRLLGSRYRLPDSAGPRARPLGLGAHVHHLHLGQHPASGDAPGSQPGHAGASGGFPRSPRCPAGAGGLCRWWLSVPRPRRGIAGLRRCPRRELPGLGRERSRGSGGSQRDRPGPGGPGEAATLPGGPGSDGRLPAGWLWLGDSDSDSIEEPSGRSCGCHRKVRARRLRGGNLPGGHKGHGAGDTACPTAPEPPGAPLTWSRTGTASGTSPGHTGGPSASAVTASDEPCPGDRGDPVWVTARVPRPGRDPGGVGEALTCSVSRESPSEGAMPAVHESQRQVWGSSSSLQTPSRSRSRCPSGSGSPLSRTRKRHSATNRMASLARDTEKGTRCRDSAETPPAAPGAPRSSPNPRSGVSHLPPGGSERALRYHPLQELLQDGLRVQGLQELGQRRLLRGRGAPGGFGGLGLPAFVSHGRSGLVPFGFGAGPAAFPFLRGDRELPARPSTDQ